MNTKLIVLLLGAITLVHLCAARPEPASKSSEELNEIEKLELKDRINTFLENIVKETDPSNKHLKIFVTILSEYATYAYDAMQQGIKAGRLIMNEPFIEKLNTDDIRTRAEEFSKYVTKAESLAKSEEDDIVTDLFELSDRFGIMVDYYNVTIMSEPPIEDVLFGLALEKNGIKEMKKKVNQSFSTFLVKMFKIMDDYIANLSTEEKESKTKLIDFMTKYKSQDIDEQMKNIKDFFTIFRLKEEKKNKEEEEKTTTE